MKYVTYHYSIFDFLRGLGELFSQKRDFHKYSLTDVYDIITEYVRKNHAEDLVMLQLIAIDYYLHFKVKPKELFLNELPKSKKFELIEELKLDHHNYRFVILPIDFDFEKTIDHNTVVKTPQNLIIQYDGVHKAKLLKSTGVSVA